jgi:hypothetical protein
LKNFLCTEWLEKQKAMLCNQSEDGCPETEAETRGEVLICTMTGELGGVPEFLICSLFSCATPSISDRLGEIRLFLPHKTWWKARVVKSNADAPIMPM